MYTQDTRAAVHRLVARFMEAGDDLEVARSVALALLAAAVDGLHGAADEAARTEIIARLDAHPVIPPTQKTAA